MDELKYIRKSVYISRHMKDIWKEIEKAANAEKRGIGFYLCDRWERDKIKNKYEQVI